MVLIMRVHGCADIAEVHFYSVRVLFTECEAPGEVHKVQATPHSHLLTHDLLDRNSPTQKRTAGLHVYCTQQIHADFPNVPDFRAV